MFWSTLLMALKEIRRNALRSVLTMLGIVIGVAAVIVLVSLGQGTTRQVADEIGKMGNNLLIARPSHARRRTGAAGSAQEFEAEDATAIAGLAGVAAVAPTSTSATTAVYGNTNHPTQVTGVTPTWAAVRGYEVALGRGIEAADMPSGQPICVLGETVRKTLFGSQDPVGESIRLQRLSCRVVGVLASKGQGAMGQDQDDMVVMPLTAMQRRVSGSPDIGMIYVSAADGWSTGRVRSAMMDLLRERRRLAPGASDDFMVQDMQEIAKAMTSATASMTALLGAIAAVSLIVGGIGIMNIMLVSVTERTREIGIRIAVGALGREVMLQFLVESVVLSVLGGAIGVALGVLGAWGAARGMGIPFVVAPATVGLAFAVSAAIGVVFGFLPARKAALLEPIEALRHE